MVRIQDVERGNAVAEMEEPGAGDKLMLPAASKSTLIRGRQRLEEAMKGLPCIAFSKWLAGSRPGPGRQQMSWGPAMANPS